MQQPKCILLIDDPDHLLLGSITLRKRGFGVMVLPGCEKFEELTEIIEKFSPTLIFMDHEMRGLCGQDLNRFLKSYPEYSEIPIIYFTGREDIIQLAKEAGADGYLRKPFQFEGLTDMAARYLPER